MKQSLFVAAGLVMGSLVVSVLLFNPPFSRTVAPMAIVAEVVHQNKEPAPAKIAIVGDIMLGRFVETLMERHGEGYPFEKISSTFAGADAAIGNFEGTMDEPHAHTPNQNFKLAAPPFSGLLLARNNFSLVSLGNNHAFDFGNSGFLNTVRALREAGIVAVGNPVSADAAYTAFETIAGQQVAFAAFNATYPSFSREVAAKTVESLRDEHPGAYVLVLMHWGEEYQKERDVAEQELAHALIDAGADAIVGGHPHVLQGIESYRGKPIFYSLGNFIFDQYFSRAVQEGLVINLSLFGSEARYELIPIVSEASQPAPATGEKMSGILSFLSGLSSPELGEGIRAGMVAFPREL